ncbi:hypothetical protein A3Q34_17655 [Colwellia sp. PAMC 20917]|nr:hypothetical protein A3Q34_17655 [Colwellia sp. PAMC 20917]
MSYYFFSLILLIIISSRLDLTFSLQKVKVILLVLNKLKNKEYTIEYGFEIDDDVWVKINTIDLSIMVENTERSRKYA